jgi:hypothetical protein
VVPRTRRLLQAIEGLVEPSHQLRVSRVNIADGLRAVDRLGECTVEEGVLDVELMHGPTPGGSQSQHSPNGGRLDDGAEGLIVVHPEALSEPPEDPTSLVPIKGAIRLELVLENPLAGDNIGTGVRGTKSHMLLDSRASYSSIARRHWGKRARYGQRSRSETTSGERRRRRAVNDPRAW